MFAESEGGAVSGKVVPLITTVEFVNDSRIES